MGNWSKSTSDSEAARRAGGRRHYNSLRQARATMRLAEVARMVNTSGGYFNWGLQTRLAAALGVSRATVSRDMSRLLELGHACPTCGHYSWMRSED